MRAYDKIQFMTVEEFNYDIRSKGEWDTPIIFSPSLFLQKATNKCEIWPTFHQ